MTKVEIIEGFVNAERPFEVCIRTKLGGYMEYFVVDRLISKDNAIMVANQYYDKSKKSDFKSVCVREDVKTVFGHSLVTIYEKEF